MIIELDDNEFKREFCKLWFTYLSMFEEPKFWRNDPRKGKPSFEDFMNWMDEGEE
jgi:hypothetical protein